MAQTNFTFKTFNIDELVYYIKHDSSGPSVGYGKIAKVELTVKQTQSISDSVSIYTALIYTINKHKYYSYEVYKEKQILVDLLTDINYGVSIYTNNRFNPQLGTDRIIPHNIASEGKLYIHNMNTEGPVFSWGMDETGRKFYNAFIPYVVSVTGFEYTLDSNGEEIVYTVTPSNMQQTLPDWHPNHQNNKKTYKCNMYKNERTNNEWVGELLPYDYNNYFWSTNEGLRSKVDAIPTAIIYNIPTVGTPYYLYHNVNDEVICISHNIKNSNPVLRYGHIVSVNVKKEDASTGKHGQLFYTVSFNDEYGTTTETYAFNEVIRKKVSANEKNIIGSDDAEPVFSNDWANQSMYARMLCSNVYTSNFKNGYTHYGALSVKMTHKNIDHNYRNINNNEVINFDKARKINPLNVLDVKCVTWESVLKDGDTKDVYEVEYIGENSEYVENKKFFDYELFKTPCEARRWLGYQGDCDNMECDDCSAPTITNATYTQVDNVDGNCTFNVTLTYSTITLYNDRIIVLYKENGEANWHWVDPFIGGNSSSNPTYSNSCIVENISGGHTYNFIVVKTDSACPYATPDLNIEGVDERTSGWGLPSEPFEVDIPSCGNTN